MKPWKLLILMTLPALLFVAWRIHSMEQERNAPVVLKQGPPERQVTDDDVVVPRKMYIDDLKSAKELKGKTVWLQAGYQLEAYPYRDHTPDFSRKEGPLPSILQLKVVDVIEAAAPKNWAGRIPRGNKNIFLIVRKPGDPGEYAVPMGVVGAGNETFYMDDFLYYDDPHTLYSHWPAAVWQAVDRHQVARGMSEMQTMMAVGQVAESESTDYGNRTVTYTAGDRKVTVTFVNDHATKVSEVAAPAG